MKQQIYLDLSGTWQLHIKVLTYRLGWKISTMLIDYNKMGNYSAWYHHRLDQNYGWKIIRHYLCQLLLKQKCVHGTLMPPSYIVLSKQDGKEILDGNKYLMQKLTKSVKRKWYPRSENASHDMTWSLTYKAFDKISDLYCRENFNKNFRLTYRQR